MFSLVLSILLVVLMFGAVLWVVDGERSKPTSGTATFRRRDADAGASPSAAPLLRRRQPATSRRVPLERAAAAAVATVAVAPAAPPPEPVRPAGPPLARHRLRSSLLLVLLVVLVGALVALVIGVVASALAFALRSAVTS